LAIKLDSKSFIHPVDPVSVDDSVTLYCEITNGPDTIDQIVWQHKRGSPVRTRFLSFGLSMPQRYELKTNVVNKSNSNYISTLRINGVRPEDFGTYICIDTAIELRELRNLKKNIKKVFLFQNII
jgi:hypothetical protein